MKISNFSRPRGFTLLETVIAIGVLAVLLTGFMVVFAPAAEGIRKSVNVQQADRLASTVEQELVTLHKGESSGDMATGFDKAFKMIAKSGDANEALMVYQYRGSMNELRDDDTPLPVADVKTKMPGKDFVVVSMMRSVKDTKFTEDLPAVEGAVFMVHCTQLVFGDGELKAGTSNQIQDPKNPQGDVGNAAAYPEAVIAFSADFYMMPAKAPDYFTGTLRNKFESLIKTPPVFTRNLAVRR